MARRRDSRQQLLIGFEDLEPEPKPREAASGPQEAELADPSAADLFNVADLSGRTVYVIDAHSLIYQVFHAMPEMSGPAGQPVGAIHGFVRDILEILEKKRPDLLFAAFDHSDDVFRSDLYPEYKQNREAMPEDLRSQIPEIHRFLETLGVPVLQLPGFEADDILATAARITEERGGQCVLVTNDKDCRQLITDKVRLFNIRKGQLYGAKELMADWAIRPEQVVDFQALVGDSTDNVPGVPLIGPKIAHELLQKYGTLDSVLDHAGEISGKKRRENLMAGRELARVSRELVRLVDDAPVDIDWDAGRVGGVDRQAFVDLCEEFGFRRLADRIGNLATRDAPKTWEANYEIVQTPEALDTLLAQLREQDEFSFDTETTSPHPRSAALVGFAIGLEAGRAYYIPVRAPGGQPRFELARVLAGLTPILENPMIGKVGQNLKFDQIVMRSHGVLLRGVVFDTMVADYLLAPGERTHDLDDLSKRYLRHRTIKTSEVIGTGRNQIRMDEANVAAVGRYAAEDADVAWRLTQILRKRMQESGLRDLYEALELPLIDVLAEMEFHGIAIDVPLLARLSERFEAQLDRLREEIFDLAGEPFNIESPKQLAKVLFDDLQLPAAKRTKTGLSTDAEVLTQLAALHDLPAKIIEYRQWAKLKNTYVDALPLLVDAKTGRVHTSFKQDVAATGRLSSADPNLQNIPIRSQEGRAIRSAFVAGEPGWELLAADYSQIELRILAHFCEDATLLKAFENEQDIHATVAAEIFQTSLEAVTPDMRRRAKAVNFGVIYGQTPFGLAKSLGIEKEEAGEFIEAYFARYPGVGVFVEETLDACRENGYVSTILGRRRNVDGVRSQSRRGDSRFRTLPERIAVNTVIQGSAADLIKTAMVNLHCRLPQEPFTARMLLQIHDELVFEAPSDQLSQLADVVRDEMVSAASLKTPLRVDIKTGRNWADCEPI